MNSNVRETSLAVANHFGCDRARVEETLQLVSTGELTPIQATELLLSHATGSVKAEPVDADAEPLDSLLARLGTPPADIVDQWCRRMRNAAADRRLTGDQPLPEIHLSDWAIGQCGQFFFRGLLIDPRACCDRVDELSEARIAQFRRFLVSETNDPPSTCEERPDEPTTPSVVAPQERTSQRLRQGNKKKVSISGRWVARAIAVGAVAAIGWILLQASRPPERTDSIARKSLSTFSPTITPDTSPRTTDATQGSLDLTPADPISATPLETIRETGAPQTSADNIDPATAATDLSLESLMPAATAFHLPDDASVPAARKPSQASGNHSVPIDEPPASPAAMISPLVDDDQEPQEPAESPQATRTTSAVDQITFVALPPTIDAEKRTTLTESLTDSCRLEFPFDVQLQLRDDQVINSRSQVVAVIKREEQGLQHNWTADASKSAVANSLIQGRLNLAPGRLVYLRPLIEADPLPIDLQKPDIKPTWDLLGPIPAKVTRISINFELPEDVEFGWIEPIDATSPRRCRGLAVLNASDREEVSLGVRFDIRGGRKLACRLRYAARLDPTAAWHVVSRPSVEQLADAIVRGIETANRQRSQFSAIYSRSDSGGRRALAAKRDAIESRVEQLQLWSERVAKLSALIAKVEAGGEIRLRLWVVWPDGRQPLLEMK